MKMRSGAGTAVPGAYRAGYKTLCRPTRAVEMPLTQPQQPAVPTFPPNVQPTPPLGERIRQLREEAERTFGLIRRSIEQLEETLRLVREAHSMPRP